MSSTRRIQVSGPPLSFRGRRYNTGAVIDDVPEELAATWVRHGFARIIDHGFVAMVKRAPNRAIRRG